MQVEFLICIKNEELNIQKIFDAIFELLKPRSEIRFTFLFIDDGSNDGSWNEILKINDIYICSKNIKQ